MCENEEEFTELIETYWNVKISGNVLRKIKTRINRNILECKERQRKRDKDDNWELIETYWNVKIGTVEGYDLKWRN